MQKRLIVSSVDPDVVKDAKFLGITMLEELGDIGSIEISKREDVDLLIGSDLGKMTIVRFPSDEIIPLENLIANLRGKTEIIVEVTSIGQARLALETLELGADGVLMRTDDPSDLPRLAELAQSGGTIDLDSAEVTRVSPLGMGSRVCVDTCSMLSSGSGLLVGSSSQGMILLQAEVEQNEFVAPRPFRVNAGSLSLYTTVPGNRTRYLEEISSGDEVTIVSRDGSSSTAYVARSKIESRPLILVEAESNGRVAKAIIQNAETVKLVTEEGSVAITDLRVGDRILAHFENGGRHFGTLVKEEEVIEK